MPIGGVVVKMLRTTGIEIAVNLSIKLKVLYLSNDKPFVHHLNISVLVFTNTNKHFSFTLKDKKNKEKIISTSCFGI